MMGMVRPPLNGTTHLLPIRCLKRGSSGLTATAVSPMMVSGRVVASGQGPSQFPSEPQMVVANS